MVNSMVTSIISNNSGTKLELRDRKEKNWEKHKHMRLNNILLNNQWVKEKIKKHLKTNESRNTMVQNLQDKAKAIVRGNFTAYLKTQEKSQIPNSAPSLARKRRTNKGPS